MKTASEKFAAFSKYQFAADGTVTKDGKAVAGEASARGLKYRLTPDEGTRQYVYAADIIAAFDPNNHGELKASAAVAKQTGGSVTMDLSTDDADETPLADAAQAAGKSKKAAPKKAAKKGHAPKELAAPKSKKVAAPKKAAAAKKSAPKKAESGTRTFEVLPVETVALIKRDLKLGTKAEGGYSISELAEKYGKSNSCIVNIKFGRIHKTVSAATGKADKPNRD